MKVFYRVGLLCILVLGIYFCYRYVQVYGFEGIAFFQTIMYNIL